MCCVGTAGFGRHRDRAPWPGKPHVAGGGQGHSNSACSVGARATASPVLFNSHRYPWAGCFLDPHITDEDLSLREVKSLAKVTQLLHGGARLWSPDSHFKVLAL